MIKQLNIENILFLDIETVPETQSYSDLDETKQTLWELKSQYQRKEEFTAEEFYERAGIWAEFGKIICISVGYFTFKGDVRQFRTTSFYGDEVQLLRILKTFLYLILVRLSTCFARITVRNLTFPILRGV